MPLMALENAEEKNCAGMAETEEKTCQIEPCSGLDRLLRDVLYILPELLRFVLVEDQRGVVRRPGHKQLHGNRIMPDLNFTMGDEVKVDGSVSNTDKMHGRSPVIS